ncbi:MAG: NAD-binding protein, partial [Acholeplasmataceae bacterium]|nr:NAD-binding protein [Acholeplasmataceae bacterium]
ASSWQAANSGPKMIENDYKPGFFVKHFLKDLKLAMEEKGELPLVVLEKVTQAYQTILDHGFSEQGTQSIIEYYLQKMM